MAVKKQCAQSPTSAPFWNDAHLAEVSACFASLHERESRCFFRSPLWPHGRRRNGKVFGFEFEEILRAHAQIALSTNGSEVFHSQCSSARFRNHMAAMKFQLSNGCALTTQTRRRALVDPHIRVPYCSLQSSRDGAFPSVWRCLWRNVCRDGRERCARPHFDVLNHVFTQSFNACAAPSIDERPATDSCFE
jgi:hypothetical protein